MGMQWLAWTLLAKRPVFLQHESVTPKGKINMLFVDGIISLTRNNWNNNIFLQHFNEIIMSRKISTMMHEY